MKQSSVHATLMPTKRT